MYSNRRSDLVLLPHLTRLHETYRVGEGDPSKMTTIPSQHRVTIQILKHWQTFPDLKITFAVSCRTEHLRLRTQQRIITTTEDSVRRTEMTNLDPLDEDVPSVSSPSSR